MFFSELYTDITTDFLSQIFGLDVSITKKKKNDFTFDHRSSKKVKYPSG